MTVEFGLNASMTLNAALSPFSVVAWSAVPSADNCTSTIPTCVEESRNPGVTTFPLPSIVRAPAGTCTLAPTARMRPPLTSTVPFSMTGPETGWMRAPVIATVSPVATGCAGRGAGFVATG